MRTANACATCKGHLKKKLAEGGSQPLLLNNCMSPSGPTRVVFVLNMALSHKDKAMIKPSVMSSLDPLGRCIVQEWMFQAGRIREDA